MDIKDFESEQHRFNWLVEHLTELSSELKTSPKSVDELHGLVVTTSFVNLGLSYAKGINTLLQLEQAEATPPLHRALYELWVELSFLLRSGDAGENAAKFSINTVLELENFIEEHKKHFTEEAIAGIKRTIAHYEMSHPEAMALIRRQRQRRQYHWSGMSRSRMERQMAGYDTQIYKVMSWEAHVVMSPIRDIEILMKDECSASFSFQPQNNLMVDPEFVAYSVGGILFFIWNEYAKHFAFPQVKIEDK